MHRKTDLKFIFRKAIEIVYLKHFCFVINTRNQFSFHRNLKDLNHGTWVAKISNANTIIVSDFGGITVVERANGQGDYHGEEKLNYCHDTDRMRLCRYKKKFS